MARLNKELDANSQLQYTTYILNAASKNSISSKFSVFITEISSWLVALLHLQRSIKRQSTDRWPFALQIIRENSQWRAVEKRKYKTIWFQVSRTFDMAQHAHGADARKVRGRYKRGVRGEANLQRNGGFCPQALNEFAGCISRWFLNPIFSNE